MTLHDDLNQRDSSASLGRASLGSGGGGGRHADDATEYDVARGVPADRVRWGPVLAGTFVALTALAVLSTLGAAIGFSSYDRGHDDVRNFAMAGGVWGLLSTVVAFALGGWVAARAAAIRGRENGMLNGMLVAAVGIPLMVYMVGSAATAMSSAEVANGRGAGDAQARSQSGDAGGMSDGAMTASARIGDTATGGDTAPAARPAADDAERGRRAAGRTAWGALMAMVLAVGASAMAGYVGARHDADERRRDNEHGRSEHGRDAGHPGTVRTAN